MRSIFGRPGPDLPVPTFGKPARDQAPRGTRRISRGKLSKNTVLSLLFRRYGSVTDFRHVVARYAAISRETGISEQTIYSAIKRYHLKGNKYGSPSRKGQLAPRKPVTPPEVERQLVSWETLNRMRFLPLRRRIDLIRREHGVKMSTDTLARLYRRNGVDYRQAKKVTRFDSEKQLRIEEERVEFAKKLRRLQEGRGFNRLIYMDQTTFLIWPKPAKTWFSRERAVQARQN